MTDALKSTHTYKVALRNTRKHVSNGYNCTLWHANLNCLNHLVGTLRNGAYAFKKHLHVSCSPRNTEKCVLYEYDHIACGNARVYHTGKILLFRVRGAGNCDSFNLS
jgi:hypothetical protein